MQGTSVARQSPRRRGAGRLRSTGRAGTLEADLDGRSGHYFDGMRVSRASAQADDPAAHQRLRKLSFDLVGLADPLHSSA